MRIRTHIRFFERIPSLSAIQPFTTTDEVQSARRNHLSGGTDGSGDRKGPVRAALKASPGANGETGAYRKDDGRVTWNLRANLGEERLSDDCEGQFLACQAYLKSLVSKPEDTSPVLA
jgi:hypothetical protein